MRKSEIILYKDVMKFENYIEQYKEIVYNKICEYLPKKTPEEHYKMVRAYTDRKEGYTRPSLLLLWTELYGGKLEDAILPAAAVQTFEDWTLIHDDWEDNTEFRRGQPAAHILYGDRYAINAGDTLHMIMWKMIYDACEGLGKTLSTKFLNKFYDMLLVITEGQYLDMHFTYDTKDITKFMLEDYSNIISAKGYFLYGPMQLGAIIADKGEKDVEQIKEYGEIIGRARQIRNDILDCTSKEEPLKITIGDDVYNGVKTAILWHFVQNAKPLDLVKVKETYMKDRKKKTEKEVKEISELFKSYGSIAYAESEADRLVEEALKKFEEVSREIPESNLKETARDAIIKLGSRVMF